MFPRRNTSWVISPLPPPPLCNVKLQLGKWETKRKEPFMPSLVLLPVPSPTIPYEDTTLILPNWFVINCCFPPRRQQGDVSKGIRQRCHIPPTKVTFTLLWIYKFPRDHIHTKREKLAQIALVGKLLFLLVSHRQILHSQNGLQGRIEAQSGKLR